MFKVPPKTLLKEQPGYPAWAACMMRVFTGEGVNRALLGEGKPDTALCVSKRNQVLVESKALIYSTSPLKLSVQTSVERTDTKALWQFLAKRFACTSKQGAQAELSKIMADTLQENDSISDWADG